jgi:dipeptidyl aminopeptidase/acylaminoacyl peptidase
MPTRFSIDRFLNIRSATSPTFSPDGRFVAFLTNITGVMQLWQVPVEGGWPTQLTFTTESVRSAHYSPIRHEIVYSMDTGGNERTQLYLLKGVGGGTDHGIGDGWVSEKLTNHPEAIHLFGGWSHDGEGIAFAANREKQNRFDIYVQKTGEKEAKLLAKGPIGYYVPHGWSPDDKYLLVSDVESNFNQNLFALEVASGRAIPLMAHERPVIIHSPCWSADGKAVYFAATANKEQFTTPYEINFTQALRGEGLYARRLVDGSDYETDAIVASPKGDWLTWLYNHDGRSELVFKHLGGSLPTPELPLGVISALHFARDDSRMAFVFEGPRHNPDIWVWDLRDSKAKIKLAEKMRRLTHSSTAGLPVARFVEPELIHYETFDNFFANNKRKIPAWYFPPAEKTDRLPPVIVYPHGGPESQTRPNFNAIFQYFIQAGYAVLAPNVRGSTGYGIEYMNLDNTTKRMDAVMDLAHAAYWLRDQNKGDPKRLAVFGGSYGGFMVLAQVTHYPELWASGIDVVGIANWITFLEKTGAYRRAHREAEYGNLREHRDFLERISPINHVDKIKCPMMVIHGANDPRVPIAEAEQIVAALKKRNIPVEYLRYEDEGHGLAKLKNRLDAYPKMVAFLDKYLK